MSLSTCNEYLEDDWDSVKFEDWPLIRKFMARLRADEIREQEHGIRFDEY